MPRCGKCGGNVDVRYAYWKGDEARHRICPRRGKRGGLSKNIRVKSGRDIQATLGRDFKDPRSYVAADGREILYETDWQARVKEVFARDGYMCHYKIERESGVIMCGAPAEHPHHIIRRSIQRDDRLTNLMSICSSHHRDEHPEKSTRFTKRMKR